MANLQGQVQGQNPRQQQQQNQKPPKTEIKVMIGDISKTANNFLIPVEIRLVKGNNALPNQAIRVKRGIISLTTIITDLNGECAYNHTENLDQIGKSISLRFLTSGTDAAETAITFTLPTEATKTDDPEKITISRHHDGNGKFTLFIRVLKTGGIGIKAPVVIEAEGVQKTILTDDQGNAKFDFGNKIRILNPGEVVEVRAKVSGIEDPAVIKLRRRQIPTPKPATFSRPWWFGTNNGRSVIFLGAMVVLWFLCIVIGYGDSLIGEPTRTLSEQQIFYNQTAKLANPNFVITPEEGIFRIFLDDTKKYMHLLTMLWSIFAIIYVPLSLREEIFEGLQEGFEKIVDRSYVQAEDPFIQRLMAWSGARGVATRKGGIIVKEGEKGEKVVRPTFWEYFRSDLLSDFIIEILPGIFRKMIG